jgi:hypothetical protein
MIGQRDDREAHVADQHVEIVQQPEHRLGQEVEPAPVDRVDEPVDAARVLVVADRLPFLGAGEELRGDLAGAAGRDGNDGQARLGLVDVGGGDVARDGGEGLAVAGDQRGHPVLVGEADPAVSSTCTTSAWARSRSTKSRSVTLS